MGTARRGSPRQLEDLVRWLHDLPLLRSCGPESLETLGRSARSIALTAGSYLYREGDAADSLAIVRTGRLEVCAADSTVIRVVGRGAVLGELGLLTGTPRSASVRAGRDSEVVVVARQPFQELLARDAAFSRSVLRNLGERLQASVDLTRPTAPSAIVALLPVTADVDARKLADELGSALGRWGPVGRLEEQQTTDTAATWAQRVDRCESMHSHTVLVATDPHDDPWSRFCLRSADRVLLLVGDGPSVGWGDDDDPRGSGHDVALCSARPEPASSSIARWAARARHRVRGGDQFAPDVARIARRLTGRAVGLVLSGGGARGLAHIGVIDRLFDAGIEIDSIGGCSMGAFVGALLAMGREPRRIQEICRRELVQRRPFNDFTVPRVSLIRARKARAMLERVFGDTHFERLDSPLFTVSADLDTGELVVHTAGHIGTAVGASMSIPGLVPPLEHGGRLLVDGGFVDNLPVDVMAAYDEGPVIAVDVMRRLPGPGTRGVRRTPSIVDTMTRATFLGSHERADANRLLADAVIAPAVADIGLLQFDRIDDAVAAGRRAAAECLEAGLAARVTGPSEPSPRTLTR